MEHSQSDEITVLFSSSSHLTFIEHDSILQTLDRVNREKGIFLNKEAFEPTVKEWDSVPLIYAQDHPNPDAYDKDPEAELARIKGRLITGQASGTRIDPTGHPKLVTTFKLQDKELEQGIGKGIISISTGMRVKNDGKQLTSTVKPHHILFFEEKPGRDEPADQGAFILSKSETKQEKLALIDRIRAWVASGPEESNGEMDMGDTKELEAKLSLANTELAAEKAAHAQFKTQATEQMQAKDKEVEKLKGELLAFKAKEADAKWQAFKGKYVPPGMVKDEANEKAARKDFEADPMGFMTKLLDLKAQADQDGANPMQFTAAKPKAKNEQEITAQMAKMGIPSLTVEE